VMNDNANKPASELTKLEHLAGLAMHGFCANAELGIGNSERDISNWSITQAVSLLEELEARQALVAQSGS